MTKESKGDSPFEFEEQLRKLAVGIALGFALAITAAIIGYFILPYTLGFNQ